MLQVKDLYNMIAWVTFIYPDDSKKVLRTTLNADILRSVLHTKPPGEFLYDLDKHKWTKIPTSNEVVVQVTEEAPILGEVDKFVNKFI